MLETIHEQASLDFVTIKRQLNGLCEINPCFILISRLRHPKIAKHVPYLMSEIHLISLFPAHGPKSQMYMKSVRSVLVHASHVTHRWSRRNFQHPSQVADMLKVALIT